MIVNKLNITSQFLTKVEGNNLFKVKIQTTIIMEIYGLKSIVETIG